VSIDYTLTDDDGQVLDSSRGGQALSYIHGTGQLVSGLERALEGRQSGDTVHVRLEPSEAYGEHDPALVHTASRGQFGGEEPEVGMQVRAEGPDGDDVLTIVAVEGDVVTLDGNHPLAGVPLTFDVQIVEVRSATAQEIAHGHAHGDGGHDH
jgi:FKBP-type peptidyl-prolyl cis-trans isomerase SlyD